MTLKSQKTGSVYFLILGIWFFTICYFYLDLLHILSWAISFEKGNNPFSTWTILIATYLSIVMICYFWLNGIKDLVYTIFFWLVPSGELKIGLPQSQIYSTKISSNNNQKPLPRVDLIYTTCNDIDEDSLLQSVKQNYPSDLIQVYILDDSKDTEYKNRVDKLASENDFIVVRRKDNKGFKAGNINNWLEQNTNLAPYFVILDSDEIIPNNFLLEALKYFELKDVAIVQANHISTRNESMFANLLARGVESHWRAYQNVKNRFGFMSLLGHGAMLDTQAVLQAGKFPMVVAEDLALAVNLAEIGKRVIFAPDIFCEETYPTNYFAFKKRHGKWTMGNMEFIKNFSWLFTSKHLTWFEKLDILLFVYNLPLTVIFVTFLLIHLILFPILGFRPYYSANLITPTILSLLAPLLNDLIYFAPRLNPFSVLKYLIHCVLLYGSMYYISFISAVKSLFGKAVFIVTPKNIEHLSLFESIIQNKAEIIFGLSLIFIGYLTNQVASVLLIAIPSILSFYLGLLGHLRTQRVTKIYEPKQKHYDHGFIHFRIDRFLALGILFFVIALSIYFAHLA